MYDRMHILLIELQRGPRRIIRELLEDEFKVRKFPWPKIISVGTAAEAQSVIETTTHGPFSIIITSDLDDGRFNLTPDLESGRFGIPVVMTHGNFHEVTAQAIDRLVETGVCACAISKPFDFNTLMDAILKHARRSS